MRRSLAMWLMVAAAAAFLCLPSGCIGSRLGRKSSGDTWSRPSLFGWGKKKSGTELAHSKPTPPSSTVAPGTAGLANNSATPTPSQPFPAQPASGSGAPQGGVPASYASTGASAYSAGGGYDDYGSAGAQGGSQNYANTSDGAAPQRGFYGDEYPGESQPQSRSQFGQTAGGGYDGYNSYNSTAGGGYQDSYGGTQQSQGYEQVADQRGSSYGSGGSSYNDQYSGADSRYVSPAGGQQQYDARNPAPSQYNDGYGSQYQGTSSDGGYSQGSQYSGGGYENTSSGGSYGSSTSGAPVQTTGGTPWTPGSTKTFNQQPLTPPTNSGYGGQY